MDDTQLRDHEEELLNQKATRNYNFFRPVGQFIEHVDTVNFSMDKDGTFHFQNVGQVNGVPSGNEAVEDEIPDGEELCKFIHPAMDKADVQKGQDVELGVPDDLMAKLKPLFYNNEEDVRLFLKEVKGMQDKDITALVNKWVAEKRITDLGNSRKGDLWGILKEAGLYESSRQNWCRRVY